MEDYEIALTYYVIENQNILDFSIDEVNGFDETDVFYRINYQKESTYNKSGRIIASSSGGSITLHKLSFDMSRYLRTVKIREIIYNVHEKIER